MVRYEGQILSARLVQLTDLGVQLFQRRRHSVGVSFSDIARESAKDPASVRRVFRGESVRPSTFSRIAEVLFKDEEILIDDRYVVAVDPNKPWPKGITSFKRAA